MTITPRSSRSRTPRDTPATVPLWREVLEVEDALRPTVKAKHAAQSRGFPYIGVTAGLIGSGGTAVLGGIVLYRQGLVRARLERAPQLQGPPIAGIKQFVRPRMAVEAAPLGAPALGAAFGLWAVLFAVPRLRRFALRWAVLPAVVGAGAYVATMWWLGRTT